MNLGASGASVSSNLRDTDADRADVLSSKTRQGSCSSSKQIKLKISAKYL
jgi:hypothetical protein